MQAYHRAVNTRRTNQSEPVLGKNQVQNNAGGFVFKLDREKQLDRFLILGSASSTFYVKPRALTLDNAKVLIDCLKADPEKTVNRIVEISISKRAANNDPAIFAMAVASTVNDARPFVYANLSQVCRIGTHLFHFMAYCKALGGFGKGKRNALGRWYTEKDIDALINQIVKYRQRDGWTHADVLRLSHPKTDDKNLNAVFKYIVDGDVPTGRLNESLRRLKVIDEVIHSEDESFVIDAVGLLNLPWEVIPTKMLRNSDVWKTLIDNNMPVEALVRNLGRMTNLDMFERKSGSCVDKVISILEEKGQFLHPLKVLNAFSVYQSGGGFLGKLSWNPNRDICDTLNDTFYRSFRNVKPSGKNVLIAVDVSGSMNHPFLTNSSGEPTSPLTCQTAAAAMAMVSYKTEKRSDIVAFYHDLIRIDLSRKSDLNGVKQAFGYFNGGTDCAKPMLYAEQNGLEYDAFVVYTDNETWFGNIHPFQALQQYRRSSGIQDAKLIVVGMTSTGFTIADPNDPYMLDCVGFDTETPALISSFIKGEI